MCHPDLSLMTYAWLPDYRGPWPDFEGVHMCVNWEKMDAWVGERRVDMFEKGLLMHPTFGAISS